MWAQIIVAGREGEHALLPVVAAQRHIFIIAPNFYLIAIKNNLPTGILTHNHCGFATAMANCANFSDIVSNCQ